MKQKLVSWALLLMCLLLFINVLQSWFSLSQRGDVLKNAADKVTEEEEKKIRLERELARVKSPDYIEEQAREKLNLSREGEITVIAPTISIAEEPTPTPVENLSNWQKWLKVFL